TGLPSGLTYDDANNQIIGTPDIITDWNDDAATGTYEETRDFPVTITVTNEAGNVTEKQSQSQYNVIQMAMVSQISQIQMMTTTESLIQRITIRR
ncbi:hypothetical protein BFS35_013630, partial [Macrococcoides goetzii]